jgi:hypothetical protein
MREIQLKKGGKRRLFIQFRCDFVNILFFQRKKQSLVAVLSDKKKRHPRRGNRGTWKHKPSSNYRRP